MSYFFIFKHTLLEDEDTQDAHREILWINFMQKKKKKITADWVKNNISMNYMNKCFGWVCFCFFVCFAL